MTLLCSGSKCKLEQLTILVRSASFLLFDSSLILLIKNLLMTCLSNKLRYTHYLKHLLLRYWMILFLHFCVVLLFFQHCYSSIVQVIFLKSYLIWKVVNLFSKLNMQTRQFTKDVRHIMSSRLRPTMKL